MTAKPKLLFVCVENANRSQMAQAFAKIFGGDRIEADSAGSQPSGQVNPRAVQFMQELGYDLTTHTSKSLDEIAGQAIEVAVTMGCGDDCPMVKARRREAWDISDPKHLSDEEFRAVRNLIAEKVKALVESVLAATDNSPN